MIVLQSPLLEAAGFRHAFSTRLGGVSPEPLGALNLQSPQANARITQDAPRDSDEALHENHARFFVAAGLARESVVADASQVHGSRVVTAIETTRARAEADAMTSARGGPAVLIRVADCVPILLGCPKTGAVAAIHAGWRGVVAGVVPAAIAALSRLGVDPRHGLAAIGPSISLAHFEIGSEVAEALSAADLASCVTDPGVHGPKHHADLVAAVALQLTRCGLPAAQIDAQPPCTYADARRFHSFRRDGARSGRLAAIVAPLA